MLQRERQRAKLYKNKYHETAISLRRKEEQYQSLEKMYVAQADRYEFVKVTERQNCQEMLEKQQNYIEMVHRLEH